MITGNADNLIKRILEEAEQKAAVIRSDAEASCDDIARAASERIAEQKASFSKAREQRVSGILDGCRTRAELDGRKEALQAKRVVLDAAFAATYSKLLALSDEKRIALYASLLKQEAKDGDVVVPAGCDRRNLEEAIKTVSIPLTLSDKEAPVDAGFLLLAGSYEKDCSMKAVLNDLREREETNVAKILFES